MSRRLASQKTQAEVLSLVIPAPDVHSISSLTRSIGETLRADISRMVKHYVEVKDWLAWSTPLPSVIDEQTLPRVHSTPQFWDDWNELHQLINLPDADTEVLKGAIEARRTLELTPELTIEATDAEICFRGSAAFLSKRHSFNVGGFGWPDGQPGWEAYITIQAIGREQA